MTLFSASAGAQNPGSEAASADARAKELRADVRNLGPASPHKPNPVDSGGRTVVGNNELHRLSVGGDGRLFWDEKPVVVRRRLLLSFWQKLGATLIGLAALMIGLSAAVHASISAHEWMCSARWVINYCPGAAPPAPVPPPKPVLPELPT